MKSQGCVNNNTINKGQVDGILLLKGITFWKWEIKTRSEKLAP